MDILSLRYTPVPPASGGTVPVSIGMGYQNPKGLGSPAATHQYTRRIGERRPTLEEKQGPLTRFSHGPQTLVYADGPKCKAGDDAPAHNPKRLILTKFPDFKHEIPLSKLRVFSRIPPL